MKIENINKLLCFERAENAESGHTIIYPFIKLLTDGGQIVPVWLQYSNEEPTQESMIQHALQSNVLLPKYQTLGQWCSLQTVRVTSLTVTFQAMAYTARHWLTRAREGQPFGEFRFFKGCLPIGWMFGTFSDSQKAAELFLAEHERHPA